MTDLIWAVVAVDWDQSGEGSVKDADFVETYPAAQSVAAKFLENHSTVYMKEIRRKECYIGVGSEEIIENPAWILDKEKPFIVEEV